jgi:hypothetical protein
VTKLYYFIQVTKEAKQNLSLMSHHPNNMYNSRRGGGYERGQILSYLIMYLSLISPEIL